MQMLTESYHDAMMLLYVPIGAGVVKLLVHPDVPPCEKLQRHLMHNFMSRLDVSEKSPGRPDPLFHSLMLTFLIDF